MVVRVALSEIKVHEGEYIDVLEFGVPEDIGRHDVKVARVESEFLVEFSTNIAEVAKFVNECRSGVETLVLACPSS